MPSQGKGTAPKVIDLESLARGYTEIGIRRLGGFITAKETDPAICIRAIELMFERGWGAVKKKDSDEGAHIVITIRNLMEEIVKPRLINGKTIDHDEGGGM
jgi:hypothetical protein